MSSGRRTTAGPHDRRVVEHYRRPGLLQLIERGLADAGQDPMQPRLEDLAPLDQFHTRGVEATLALASLAGIERGEQVLDLGGGIGGAGRVLAARYGALVTVLELTPDYCAVGKVLTARTGLSARVRHLAGDATNPPLEAGAFDVVWTQHSAMNISHQERLYAAAHLMLRPGGRLALHDVMAGAAQPIHFPMPWAAHPSISHLRPPESVRAAIQAVGFGELHWRDCTRETLEWLQARLAKGGVAPPVSVHLLLGEGFRTAFENLARNLREDRVRVVEAVFQRAVR